MRSHTTARPADVKEYMIWVYELKSLEQTRQDPQNSNLSYSLLVSSDDAPRTVAFPVKSDSSYEIRFDQLTPSRIFDVFRFPPILSFSSSVEIRHNVVFEIKGETVVTQLVSTILER